MAGIKTAVCFFIPNAECEYLLHLYEFIPECSRDMERAFGQERSVAEGIYTAEKN